MKNQHKVIPILAGILFSDGILAQSAGGELYPKKPSMPSTDIPAVSKKAESLNKNEFVKFDRQLAKEPLSGPGALDQPSKPISIPKPPPTSSLVIPNNNYIGIGGGENSGNGSTIPQKNPINIEGAGDLAQLSKTYAKLQDAIKSSSAAEIQKIVIDMVIDAYKASGVKMTNGGFFDEVVIRRQVSKYLSESAINTNNVSSLVGKMGAGVVTDAVINMAINSFSTAISGGNLSIKEGVWLTLKHVAMYAQSGGNPVYIALGESAILQEVVLKDIEASIELMENRSDAKKSKTIGLISDAIFNGAMNYSKGSGNIVSSRQYIEELINK